MLTGKSWEPGIIHLKAKMCAYKLEGWAVEQLLASAFHVGFLVLCAEANTLESSYQIHMEKIQA